MRMQSQKSRELRVQAVNLHFKGLQNKEIASKLSTTEATISKWLKPILKKIELLEETKTLLIKKMNEMLKDPKSKPNDIKDLAYSLTQIKSVEKGEIVYV